MIPTSDRRQMLPQLSTCLGYHPVYQTHLLHIKRIGRLGPLGGISIHRAVALLTLKPSSAATFVKGGGAYNCHGLRTLCSVLHGYGCRIGRGVATPHAETCCQGDQRLPKDRPLTDV